MAWVFLLLIPLVSSNIVSINESLPPHTVFYIRSSLRTSPDSPSVYSNITLTLTSPLPSAPLEVNIYSSFTVLSLLRSLGTESELRSGSLLPSLCASQENPSSEDLNVTWPNNSDSVTYTAVNLTDGIYYTLFANCMQNSTAVNLTGTLIALNPYGYLPGEAFPLLNFYKLLSGLYCLLLFVWTATICMYRDSAISLQKWVITSVLSTGLVEYMLTFAVCEYVNFYGEQPVSIVFLAAITKGIKDTFIRVLMLAIAKGVGVVGNSISKATALGITILAVAYLVAHMMYEKVLYRNMHHHASNEGKYFSPVFLSICSTLFFYWTYISLLVVRKDLKAVKQTFKLHKMKEVTGVLVITGIWAVAWVGFQNYFTLTRSQDEYWHFHWLFEGMWQLVFLFVVCALAWLWRPDEQWSVREGSEEIRQEDDSVLEEEKEREVELTSRSYHPFGYSVGIEEGQD